MLLAMLLPSPLAAQKTEADIQARLVGQPLYLRGLWSRTNWSSMLRAA